MTKLAIPKTLQFISGLNENDKRLKKAISIVDISRNKRSIVIDEHIKIELDEIITETTRILKGINQRTPLSEEELMEHCIALQSHSAHLPKTLPQKNTLASTSNTIAVACLFVLGFTLAISLGFAFHAWYFAYLTLDLFLDYAAIVSAAIGIPAAVLGLFAYQIYAFQGDEIKTTNALQEDINEFCEEVVAGLTM